MIETERLHLRRPTPQDADMAHHVEGWERHGIGKFVVECDGVVVGRVGIQLLPDGWELGWTIAPERRGRGYATEAARAARAWARSERGIDRIVSLIAPDNLPSQRVAERLGAAPTETLVLPDSTEAVVWLHP